MMWRDIPEAEQLRNNLDVCAKVALQNLRSTYRRDSVGPQLHTHRSRTIPALQVQEPIRHCSRDLNDGVLKLIVCNFSVDIVLYTTERENKKSLSF